jgi:hypothetical protein
MTKRRTALPTKAIAEEELHTQDCVLNTKKGKAERG